MEPPGVLRGAGVQPFPFEGTAGEGVLALVASLRSLRDGFLAPSTLSWSRADMDCLSRSVRCERARMALLKAGEHPAQAGLQDPACPGVENLSARPSGITSADIAACVDLSHCTFGGGPTFHERRDLLAVACGVCPTNKHHFDYIFQSKDRKCPSLPARWVGERLADVRLSQLQPIVLMVL